MGACRVSRKPQHLSDGVVPGTLAGDNRHSGAGRNRCWNGSGRLGLQGEGSGAIGRAAGSRLAWCLGGKARVFTRLFIDVPITLPGEVQPLATPTS